MKQLESLCNGGSLQAVDATDEPSLSSTASARVPYEASVTTRAVTVAPPPGVRWTGRMAVVHDCGALDLTRGRIYGGEVGGGVPVTVSGAPLAQHSRLVRRRVA